MKKVQQDVMCVLLQTLLDQKLITKDVYEKSREKILNTLDWPAFFCCTEAKGEAEWKYVKSGQNWQ